MWRDSGETGCPSGVKLPPVLQPGCIPACPSISRSRETVRRPAAAASRDMMRRGGDAAGGAGAASTSAPRPKPVNSYADSRSAHAPTAPPPPSQQQRAAGPAATQTPRSVSCSSLLHCRQLICCARHCVAALQQRSRHNALLAAERLPCCSPCLSCHAVALELGCLGLCLTGCQAADVRSVLLHAAVIEARCLSASAAACCAAMAA